MPSFTRINAGLSLIDDNPSRVLDVKFGSEEVQPAVIIPRANAQSPPEISFRGATGKYLVINLDLDAPFQSFNFMSPIVHWLQSDLEVEGTTLKSKSPPAMPWAAPRPPPGAAPHRYVFFLYQQPDSFDATKYQGVGRSARVRFDLEAFEKENGLGEILATNYFNSH